MPNPFLISDIGTTTISAAILDRASSHITVSDSVLNSQIKFGDDVISRIDFALKNPRNIDILQKTAVSSLNLLIGRLLKKALLGHKDIKAFFCVSNTAMHHLFLGINPSSLVVPPYKAAQKSEVSVYANTIGLNLDKDIPVKFLPNIGGFVGSDALAVIISSGIYDSKVIKLAIDIGTNGEIILGNKDRIWVASTAAGPAFEASHISCGMPAEQGAIESIRIKKGQTKIKVIGARAPEGICGSGLIESAYQMLKAGIMDRSGKMIYPEFVIYKRAKKKIFITQQDIRKMQLAKAAIYAGIKILLKRQQIIPSEIKEVLITGSFGNRLNPDAVVGIGLVPGIEKAKIRFLKGGALEGLRIYLTKRGLENKTASILARTRHLPLIGKGFGNEFTSSLEWACK